MSNWISVKDKLPENCEECLCYTKSKDGKFYSIVHCQYINRKWAVKVFCEDNYYVLIENGMISNPEKKYDNHFYFGEVTHWFPLPIHDKEFEQNQVCINPNNL